MSAELIVAIAGVITALFTGAIAFYNSHKAARKDLVEMLQEEIERLGKRIVDLEQNKTAGGIEAIELQRRVYVLETDNALLKKEIAALRAENISLGRENRRLQARIKELEGRFDAKAGDS